MKKTIRVRINPKVEGYVFKVDSDGYIYVDGEEVVAPKNKELWEKIKDVNIGTWALLENKEGNKIWYELDLDTYKRFAQAAEDHFKEEGYVKKSDVMKVFDEAVKQSNNPVYPSATEIRSKLAQMGWGE